MPIYIMPQAADTPVVEFIQEAKGQLVMNNYFLDDAGILDAIAQRVASDSNDKTIVIVEPRPFGMSQERVAEEYADLRKTGADVVDAPPQFATGDVFDHAKYAVADNEALIGTANWSFSAFSRNREYILVSQDPAIVSGLQSVAQADIVRQNVTYTPGPLVISPDPAVPGQIAEAIDQPGPVGIETEEIQPDNPLMPALEQRAQSIYMIVPSRLDAGEYAALATLQTDGAHIRQMSDPYMHAKIICGQSMVFIGSQNFSTTSMTENREVGIVLQAQTGDAQDKADAKTVTDQFNRDWNAALPLTDAASNGAS